MLLSALSFLVVAQSSSEVPEGLMNNPVYSTSVGEIKILRDYFYFKVCFILELADTK